MTLLKQYPIGKAIVTKGSRGGVERPYATHLPPSPYLTNIIKRFELLGMEWCVREACGGALRLKALTITDPITERETNATHYTCNACGQGWIQWDGEWFEVARDF